MESRPKAAQISKLITSGFLLIMAGAGWISHAGNANKSASQSNVEIEQPVKIASLGVQTARIAPAEASSETRPDSMWNAVKIARQSCGRSNPMTPMDRKDSSLSKARKINSTSFTAMSGKRWPERSNRHSHLFVPPPPDTSSWGVIPQLASSTPETHSISSDAENPLPTLAMAAEMRLVGLVDDKAIFSIPKDTARRFNLPQSVTLGPGLIWNGIKLVGVSKESATLTDTANRVFEKHLSSIR